MGSGSQPSWGTLTQSPLRLTSSKCAQRRRKTPTLAAWAIAGSKPTQPSAVRPPTTALNSAPTSENTWASTLGRSYNTVAPTVSSVQAPVSAGQAYGLEAVAVAAGAVAAASGVVVETPNPILKSQARLASTSAASAKNNCLFISASLSYRSE